MIGNILAYTSAACLFMAVGGCAVFQGSISRSPASTQPDATVNERYDSDGELSSGDSASIMKSGPAVQALINQANDHIANEDFQNAAVTLERALRIESKNPELYSRLAGVMLLQGQPDEAESLAKRSNSLSEKRPDLQYKNWTIISRALRSRGENASADAAEMRANQLKRLAGE